MLPRRSKAGETMRKRRREGNARAAQGTARGRESYTIQTCDPSVEQNRCQVGATILFECPAQIPRSSLRSFSLWARHSAETSAELNVRSVRRNFSPWPAGRCEGEDRKSTRLNSSHGCNSSAVFGVNDT